MPQTPPLPPPWQRSAYHKERMMNESKKRVLDALEGKIPDKIPFMFCFIEQPVADGIAGKKLTDVFGMPHGIFPKGDLGKQSFVKPYEPGHIEVARKLGLDAMGIKYFPPMFAEVAADPSGHEFIVKGLLTSKKAIDSIIWPDVDDERLYEPMCRYAEAYGGEFAIYAGIRMGISFILNSVGLEKFSYAIYDEPEMIKELMDKYCRWAARLNKNLIAAGVDFFWTFDDLAYKANPMFSGDVFREFFFPYIKNAVDKLTVPWIFHSDGNLFPVLDDLLKLGMNAIHPLEPGAMDLERLKKEYGSRVTLVGNIDIDYTLTQGNREEIFKVVKDRIDLLGPGGRYIISDSNSVPYFCSAENVKIAAEAVQKYRNIY
jgi:uroporphyrinogen decarboxylase